MFGIEGDDLYLCDGWSAEQHFNNRARPWSLDDLDNALLAVDPQDRGWFIAPSQRKAGPAPSDEVLAALNSVR